MTSRSRLKIGQKKESLTYDILDFLVARYNLDSLSATYQEKRNLYGKSVTGFYLAFELFLGSVHRLYLINDLLL